MALPSRSTLKRTLLYAPLGPALWWGTVAALGYSLSQLSLPWIVGRIVDDALTAKRSDLLLEWAGLLAVCATVSILCKSAHTMLFTWVAERAVLVLRRNLLAHLQKLPLEVVSRDHSGRLTSLFTSDLPAMAEIYSFVLGGLVLSVLQLVSLLAFVTVVYGKMVLFMLLLVPFYLGFPLLFSRKTRDASRRLQEARADLSSKVQESVEAIREIKTFTREDWNLARLQVQFREVFGRRLRLTLIDSVYSLNYAAYWLTISVMYWLGGRSVIAGEITVGQLIALVWCLGLLDTPISRFVTLTSKAQAALGSAERVFSHLDDATEAEQAAGTVTLLRDLHSVEFWNVCFQYPSEGGKALDNVSFRVDAGQRIAIVGPSGAGKSTLMSLLIRLYEPQEGSVRVAGRDVCDYDLASLREQIAVLFQDPFLFSGTVAENIGFGRLDAGPAEIAEAAQAANASQFILRLPQGFNTQLGERGLGLSVGEKQRLAIARVILRDPSILILDEPTSAQDAESDRLVTEGLQRLLRGRTSFVIAHRLSTVTNADAVLVLDQGRVAGFGTHYELHRTCPLYQRLVDLQLAAPDTAGAQARVAAG